MSALSGLKLYLQFYGTGLLGHYKIRLPTSIAAAQQAWETHRRKTVPSSSPSRKNVFPVRWKLMDDWQAYSEARLSHFVERQSKKRCVHLSSIANRTRLLNRSEASSEIHVRGHVERLRSRNNGRFGSSASVPPEPTGVKVCLPKEHICRPEPKPGAKHF
jgi:hypothetical protein